jgi:hypothetical protein
VYFDDGEPADDATINTSFACHAAVEASDIDFTRYAPWRRSHRAPASTDVLTLKGER